MCYRGGGGNNTYGGLLDVGNGLYTKHFGTYAPNQSFLEKIKSFFSFSGSFNNLPGKSDGFRYTAVGSNNNQPDSAVDYTDYPQYDYDDAFGLSDDDDNDEAKLLHTEATTTTTNTHSSVPYSDNTPVPKLDAPQGDAV